MLFYFIAHTILGFFGASTYLLHEADVVEKPLWLSSGAGQLYSTIAIIFIGIATIAAPIITIFEFGWWWGLATVGELLLGTVIARLIWEEIRVLSLVVSPFVVIIIMGALLDFWRL